MDEKETNFQNGAPPQILSNTNVNDVKSTTSSYFTNLSSTTSSSVPSTSTVSLGNNKVEYDSTRTMTTLPGNHPNQRINYPTSSTLTTGGNHKFIFKSNHSLDNSSLVNGQTTHTEHVKANPNFATQVLEQSSSSLIQSNMNPQFVSSSVQPNYSTNQILTNKSPNPLLITQTPSQSYSNQRFLNSNTAYQNKNLIPQLQGSSVSLQATPVYQNKTTDNTNIGRKSSDSGLGVSGDSGRVSYTGQYSPSVGSAGPPTLFSNVKHDVSGPYHNVGATPSPQTAYSPITNMPTPSSMPKQQGVRTTGYNPNLVQPVGSQDPRPPVGNLPGPPPAPSNMKYYRPPLSSAPNLITPNQQYGGLSTHQYTHTPPTQYGNTTGPSNYFNATSPHYTNTNSSPMGNRYPGVNQVQQSLSNMSVTQGFNKLWGIDTIDLLQCRNIMPNVKVDPPKIKLHQEYMQNSNCSPECTLNKIPETNSLLQKSRLPLGILIHPFRDLSQLAVIQCATIVRCKTCRTYINPFVYFIDTKRWKCNLCFRANELPDEFQYDPVTKTYGDPTRRPEVKSATIEFIAPSEYMLRPPQPAIYLFVLDVSRIACETGYLEVVTNTLLEELDNLPGDSRTQIGFILFDSFVRFFSIAENFSQAHEMIVMDIDDVFLPTPDSLLVNLNENRQLIKDLLEELPKRYSESFDTNSALGAALQAAYKLMAPTGGRITVFQSCLPNYGPGSLQCREDPNQRAAKEVHHLGPQTDFYKRLSLDCSTQQISVDLFLVNAQYADLATISGVSQFSGGCVYHFPLFRKQNAELTEKLVRCLRRYLTRKIGFEAVMRIRCSRGLSIHTFHGNFFVRSTDLLSLPNVNPDAGFGMQVSIEESLSELESVCFQAALLYTSAKGERRIRVHTLCLPVTTSLSDVLTSADQQCIIGLLAKMAVDRSLKASVSDARDAFINVAVDVLAAYKLVETSGGHSGLIAPSNLALIPLYILALLKSTAFRTGQSTRLDDRVFAMLQMKTLPLKDMIQTIHFDLYNITVLDDKTNEEYEGQPVVQPQKLTLSSEQIDSRGCYLLDSPDLTYCIVGKTISPTFISNIFGVSSLGEIDLHMMELPELDNEDSKKLRHFINYLNSEKPFPSVLKIALNPNTWSQFLITDRADNSLSYYEFLQHIKAQIK